MHLYVPVRVREGQRGGWRAAIEGLDGRVATERRHGGREAHSAEKREADCDSEITDHASLQSIANPRRM